MSPVISVGDSRGARLGDLADEHEREVHLFRPDQPQLSPVRPSASTARFCSPAIAARAASVSSMAVNSRK